MTAYTSTYAGVWRALTRILGAASYPTAPVPNVAPVKAWLSNWGKDGEPVEGILISTSTRALPSDDQGYVTTGFKRDERFETDVFVRTALGNRSASQALDRLEQLTIVAEQTIRAAMAQTGLPGEVGAFAWWWWVRSIESGLWMLPDSGVAGMSKITIAVQARIGG